VKRSEPLIGLAIACIGIVLVAVSKFKSPTKRAEKV